jgi:L-lysine 6-transaminase
VDEAAVEQAESQAIAQIRAAVAQDPDDIACLIIEPIQGEGGDNHFRGEFLRQLRQLANELDFLLIFDEIQTGLGTTGRWWAHQHWDVRPDILVFGKKVQTCGIAVSKRIDEVPDNVFKVPSRINSTWGGNLVDMVRATRILEVIGEENLIEHCAQQGQRLLKGLQDLHEEFEDFTSNPRGRGMFAALDLCTSELRDEVLQQAHELGLLCLASGEKGIRLRPALNLPPWDLDLGIELLRKSLQSVAPTRPGRLKK